MEVDLEVVHFHLHVDLTDLVIRISTIDLEVRSIIVLDHQASEVVEEASVLAAFEADDLVVDDSIRPEVARLVHIVTVAIVVEAAVEVVIEILESQEMMIGVQDVMTIQITVTKVNRNKTMLEVVQVKTMEKLARIKRVRNHAKKVAVEMVKVVVIRSPPTQVVTPKQVMKTLI